MSDLINADAYRPVTAAIIAELEAIVGQRYVISNDHDKLEPFGHDEIPGTVYRHLPEAVVRPRTAAEISALMKLANRERVPVTPRGAGSGLSGGAVPVYGGIVLCTDRMNQILELDRDNMMLVVEPGVVANDINEYLKEYDLFYAGYPMSMETCFIGGNVAENAGGGKAVKYGVTGRYVLGLETVMPNGDIIEYGGKLLKDVTGYNMVQLLVGSEGTLGIFTKIILKLVPLPKYQIDLLCLFPSSDAAIAAVPRMLNGGSQVPTSIEFMDRLAVQGACQYLHETLPWEDAGAMLLVSVDGADLPALEAEYERLGEACLAGGASEVYVADNPTTSERVWKVRRAISEAYSQVSPYQCAEDLVVPPAAIAPMVSKFAELAATYQLRIPCFGHAGDGNLHARIIANADSTPEQWQQQLPLILRDLYAITRALGGRISGEHGIGCKRKNYMTHVVSPEYIEVLRAIKRSLDPNGILNPGKIFDL